jgi:hypothetical protein
MMIADAIIATQAVRMKSVRIENRMRVISVILAAH